MTLAYTSACPFGTHVCVAECVAVWCPPDTYVCATACAAGCCSVLQCVAVCVLQLLQCEFE